MIISSLGENFWHLEQTSSYVCDHHGCRSQGINAGRNNENGRKNVCVCVKEIEWMGRDWDTVKEGRASFTRCMRERKTLFL